MADATSEEPEPDPYEGKNPAAVELGRQGGLKGGRARAEKLTPEQRSEIARKAAARPVRDESAGAGGTMLAARLGVGWSCTSAAMCSMSSSSKNGLVGRDGHD